MPQCTITDPLTNQACLNSTPSSVTVKDWVCEWLPTRYQRLGASADEISSNVGDYLTGTWLKNYPALPSPPSNPPPVSHLVHLLIRMVISPISYSLPDISHITTMTLCSKVNGDWICGACMRRFLALLTQPTMTTTVNAAEGISRTVYQALDTQLVRVMNGQSGKPMPPKPVIPVADYTEDSHDQTEDKPEYRSLGANESSSKMLFNRAGLVFPNDLRPSDRLPFTAPLAGLELEVGCGGHEIISKFCAANNIDMTYDGSVNGGVEFRCPPNAGESLEKMIIGLTKLCIEAGCKIDKRCGLHVHLDMRSATPEIIYRFCYLWAKCEADLYAMMPPSRRGIGQPTSWYCTPFSVRWRAMQLARQFGHFTTESTADEKLAFLWRGIPKGSFKLASSVTNSNYLWSQRYLALNLNAYAAHKTIEVRLHSSTLMQSKIIPWICLLQSMYAVAERMSDEEISEYAESFGKDTTALLVDIAATDEAKKYITTRQEKFADLNTPAELAKVLVPAKVMATVLRSSFVR